MIQKLLFAATGLVVGYVAAPHVARAAAGVLLWATYRRIGEDHGDHCMIMLYQAVCSCGTVFPPSYHAASSRELWRSHL